LRSSKIFPQDIGSVWGVLNTHFSHRHDDFRGTGERDEGNAGFIEIGTIARLVPVMEPPSIASTLSSSTRRVAKVRALLASRHRHRRTA